MHATKRDGELVAHPATERARLCEPKVMWIRRYPAAYQTCLFRHEFPVIFVAYANGLAQCRRASLGARFVIRRWRRLAASEIGVVGTLRPWGVRSNGRFLIGVAVAERRQFLLEMLLNQLGVECRERVLGTEAAVRPARRLIRRAKALQLGQQAISQGRRLVGSENRSRISQQSVPGVAPF